MISTTLCRPSALNSLPYKVHLRESWVPTNDQINAALEYALKRVAYRTDQLSEPTQAPTRS
ncbi:hypothetical protein EVJ58_g10914 [Rhodofomes roseus]|uniref:Uncharacterized protein n=1 Tax=Rhodofomes roseus TaxID=34475 RepID=A0A4Y9XL31_9APHY|nr:hypothetical protein EVJ58_g10914 [Rhodofomes roseus]